MEKYSGSHTTSRKSSLPHNRREEEFTGKNVDPNGIHEQWFRKDIDVLYDEYILGFDCEIQRKTKAER